MPHRDRSTSSTCQLQLRSCLVLAMVCVAVVFGQVTHTAAQNLPSLGLEAVATDLDLPVALTHAGDGRLYISLLRGQVVIWDEGEILPQPLLDISDRIGFNINARGLFSIAFHPDFQNNGWVFVSYSNQAGQAVTSRLTVDAATGVVDSGSEVVLLAVDKIFFNHNGGQLHFGPDGYLYVSSGDSGAAFDPLCTAQAIDNLDGKLLRLDVDQKSDEPPYYGIPSDNPFLGDEPRDEIWALGLRNPWRFSFDRQTGDLYIGDVGQNSREEVDFEPAGSPGGRNYGWKMLEGTLCLGSSEGCPQPLAACDFAGYTAPVLEYTHSDDNCSITGGYVYRGEQIPELDGVYFYGDLCSGSIWAAQRSAASWQTQQLSLNLPNLVSFGEDADGELYLIADSTVYRLVSAADPGRIEWRVASYGAREDAGAAAVIVRRSGGTDGEVSVDYTTADGSATAGTDYRATSGTLTWNDGEGGDKTLLIPLIDDSEPETDETVVLRLTAATGGATLGAISQAELTVVDDDNASTCAPSATALCLNGQRFRAEMTWRTPQGDSGVGQAQPLTDDSGYFWFFDEANVEVIVKVLAACFDPWNHYWVFAAGLTNVEARLTVTDLASGERQIYENPLGAAFQPIQDTAAFATCP